MPPSSASAPAPAGRPCPLCGNPATETLPTAHDEHRSSFPRRQCRTCGTAFLDPQPTAAAAIRQFFSGRAISSSTPQHACWEQNLYDWLQGALRAINADRYLLKECPKDHRSQRADRPGEPAIHTLLGTMLAPPAVFAEVGGGLARSGATVEVTFCNLS